MRVFILKTVQNSQKLRIKQIFYEIFCEYMENFFERLKQMIDFYANGRNTFFAEKIGMGESNVRSWLNGTLPKLDAIEKIARNSENISLEWLIMGEGSMIKDDVIQEKALELPSDNAEKGVITELRTIIKDQAKEIARKELELERLRSSDAATATP